MVVLEPVKYHTRVSTVLGEYSLKKLATISSVLGTYSQEND